jgi:hypothetical protein
MPTSNNGTGKSDIRWNLSIPIVPQGAFHATCSTNEWTKQHRNKMLEPSDEGRPKFIVDAPNWTLSVWSHLPPGWIANLSRFFVETDSRLRQLRHLQLRSIPLLILDVTELHTNSLSPIGPCHYYSINGQSRGSHIKRLCLLVRICTPFASEFVKTLILLLPFVIGHHNWIPKT